jgi:RNA polymerase sigma-70 factor (ECF subfamily)
MTTPMQPAPTVEALLAEREWIERIARRISRDAATADDVAQEAWRRGLASPPVRLTSPRGWIRALVTSAARDLHRGESRRAARERAASRDERMPAADVLVARAEAHRLVLDEVLALDPPSRDVVLQRYFEGLAPAEIARRRGEPAATVRSRLHRALAVLRARLTARGGGSARWAVLAATPAAASRGLDSAAVAKGALLVTTTTKATIGAAALVLLALLLFRHEDVAPPPAPKQAPERAAAPPRKRPVPEPQAPGEPAPAGTNAATAAVVPAASGPTRLALRMLAPRAPDPPPDMQGKRTLDASGQVVKIDSEPAESAIRLGGGGGGGGVSIVGREKWKPVPEKGTVTLKGRVLDARGEPLAGAEVLRIDPEAGGADGDVVDFRHIATVGTTARDGTFTLERQPARPYRLAANWNHAMSRPRGLFFAGLVAVEPRDGQTLSGLELRVPLNASDFGAVTGRVTDEDGAPVRAEVSVGLVSVRSGRDGRYRLEGVPVGSQRVECEDFAMRPAARTVTVSATADVTADFVLVPAGTGPHEISGVVRDEDGAPVAGLEMWCGGTADVSRHGVTGDDGTFRFARLPAPPEGLAYTVSLMPDYEKPVVLPASVHDVVPPKTGLVVVAQRTVSLRLVVRDAETGAALPLFNATLERRVVEDGEEKLVPFRSATLYEEDGAWDVEVARGETVLFLEAPGHKPFHAAVDLPKSSGEYEVVVEMQR